MNKVIFHDPKTEELLKLLKNDLVTLEYNEPVEIIDFDIDIPDYYS